MPIAQAMGILRFRFEFKAAKSVPFQAVAYLAEKENILRRFRLGLRFGSRLLFFAAEPVYGFDKKEHHKGNEQEVYDVLNEFAVIYCHLGNVAGGRRYYKL